MREFKLWASCLGVALSFAGAAGAAQVPITGVSVYGGTPSFGTSTFDPATGDYPANDAVDNNLGTDYASNGGGANTFLDFNLGSVQTLSQIAITDRTSSGGGNGSHEHGVSEFSTGYTLRFSNDPNFPAASTTSITGLTATAPTPDNTNTDHAGDATHDSDFTTTYSLPFINAQYVQVQVTANPGVNSGFAEVQFSTPEPAALGLLALAAPALLARRRRTPTGR